MDLGLIYVWYFYKYYFVWLKGDSNLKFKKNFNCFGNIKIIIEYLRVFVNFNYIFIYFFFIDILNLIEIYWLVLFVL